MPDATRVEDFGRQGADFRQSLIKAMAQVYGGVSSNGKQISHERELEEWMKPTSPAAQQALQMGGTHEDAVRANQMFAAWMKSQGATDEDIARTCRAGAYELGKTNSENDPEKEHKYHVKMSAKAMAAQSGGRPQITDVTGEEAGSASDNRTLY